MTTIKVLVTRPISTESCHIINGVSSDLEIIDASEQFLAEQDGLSGAKEKLDALLSDAEVIYSRLPVDLLNRAPKLKWVQVRSAGVNRFLNDEFRRHPAILTNMTGNAATPIAEFVLQLMLMFVKQASLLFQLKQEKQWRKIPLSVLRSKTVGIVGLGHIGREVARLAKAFGMNMVATRRSAKDVRKARYVDKLMPSKHLPQLPAESDFVVLTLPLTPETNELIGEKELRTMKPSAYIINIARGGIIDKKALLQALNEHWIAGAGLDVFAVEPLPLDSPLWSLPNVLFSPHISGRREDSDKQATRLFSENLRRYLSGKRLLNVVDKKKGY
ncbi:D-2-hydroxyacid dehydrogenase [Chloroflexota bacterium]